MRTRCFPSASPLLFLAPLLLSLAACSAEAGTASSETTANVAASVATGADVGAGPRGGHDGHGGPEGLVAAALHEPIGLTSDQQQTLLALLVAMPHPPHEGGKALAASIRAGAIVATEPNPSEDELAVHRAAAALATLHATLSPTQRRALVDAIEQKAGEHGKHGPGGDHHGGPAEGAGGHGPMGHLLEGLDLTAAQQATLKAKLDAARPAPPSESERAAKDAEHEAMHAAMNAKLETFAGESFDAAAFVTPPMGARARKPDGHRDRFVADLAIVTSVLDAAQREKLAQRIEAGPPAPVAAPLP